MTKKILFIMHDFSRGGIQAFVYHLIKALPKDLFSVSILYYNDITTMLPEFEALDIEISYFSNKNIKSRYRAFKKVISDINPDLIHFQGHEGMFIMFFWLWRMGQRKIVNTFHSTHFDEISYITKIFESLAQLFYTKIVHVAKETEDRYSKEFHTSKHKHLTIYNGIDVDAIIAYQDTCNKPRQFPSNQIHIIGVANFHPQKGYKYSLPALHKMIEENPQIHYHILGGSDDFHEIHEWTKEYIAANNLEGNITLHGQVDNVIDYLYSADIFLSPSEKELMPVSFLEALAVGLPIVGTNTGGVPEILGFDNEYGILIDPRSPKQIIDALTSLIEDSKKRAFYSQKSKERAQYFSIHRISKQYIELYNQILSKDCNGY